MNELAWVDGATMQQDEVGYYVRQLVGPVCYETLRYEDAEMAMDAWHNGDVFRV